METSSVKIGFDQQIIVLPLHAILPLRQIPEAVKKTAKYRRILKSIGDVGIIEPLVVAPHGQDGERYMLLDGHVRYEALQERGDATVHCLVSHDDEAFTFNKRINRLATVQEHFMIVRALERGVSAEKLASALDVNIGVIKRRKTLLDGVCAEAVELLKDKQVNPSTFESLRKMKPLRQIECAELMLSVQNFSASYAKALFAATRREDLMKPEREKKVGGITAEQMARMEREMESLQQDFKVLEASYGDDVLNLVIASGWLSKLLTNRKVTRYLEKHQPEILKEFQNLISSASLDQSTSDLFH